MPSRRLAAHEDAAVVTNTVRVVAAGSISVAIVMMVLRRAVGQPGHGSRQLPPAWTPDRASTYPFSDWIQGVLLWSALDEQDKLEQTYSIVASLEGEVWRQSLHLSPDELASGGRVHGQAADPVVYLLTYLAHVYAQEGEVLHILSLQALFEFSKRDDETVDDMMNRFAIVKSEAESTYLRSNSWSHEQP